MTFVIGQSFLSMLCNMQVLPSSPLLSLRPLTALPLICHPDAVMPLVNEHAELLTMTPHDPVGLWICENTQQSMCAGGFTSRASV